METRQEGSSFRSPLHPSPPGDNLLATTGLIARRAGARNLFTGGLLAQNWQVVRAIDGETHLLPVLIYKEQEHEHVSQNDPDYGNHSHIPYLAVVAPLRPRLGYLAARSFKRPQFGRY